jgi:DNA-3-methyladenine glycosylase I
MLPGPQTVSTSPASAALSKDLRKRGWKFVGPTTAYAFMQGMGLINDHVDGCVIRARAERERVAFTRPVSSPGPVPGQRRRRGHAALG